MPTHGQSIKCPQLVHKELFCNFQKYYPETNNVLSFKYVNQLDY